MKYPVVSILHKENGEKKWWRDMWKCLATSQFLSNVNNHQYNKNNHQSDKNDCRALYIIFVLSLWLWYKKEDEDNETLEQLQAHWPVVP